MNELRFTHRTLHQNKPVILNVVYTQERTGTDWKRSITRKKLRTKHPKTSAAFFLYQQHFNAPGFWRSLRWWTRFVLNRSERSNAFSIIRACPANFKQRVWQSRSVGALFWLLASCNTFLMKTWETFPSIAPKRLSVHQINRSTVSSHSSSQEEGVLACDKMIWFQLAGCRLLVNKQLLTELCTCDFMTRQVSLRVRTTVIVFTSSTSMAEASQHRTGSFSMRMQCVPLTYQ